MPRNRTARLGGAGLVRPAPATPHLLASPHALQARRRGRAARRCVSLALITSTSASRRRPAARRAGRRRRRADARSRSARERVARPFRDAYGWFDDLLDAKDENEKLREGERASCASEAIRNQTAAQENLDARSSCSTTRTGPGPEDYRLGRTRASLGPPVAVRQAAHDRGGLERRRPAERAGASPPDGLVGQVTELSPDDREGHAAHRPVERRRGVLDLADRRARARPVTARARARSSSRRRRRTRTSIARRPDRRPPARASPRLPSLFPRGIPIGIVTSASASSDTELFKQIQVVRSSTSTRSTPCASS